MIFFRIKTSGILLIIVFSLVGCLGKKASPKLHRLTENIILGELNPEYFVKNKQLTDSTSLLSFIYGSQVGIRMGNIFHFYTKKAFYIKSIHVTNTINRKNKTNYFFKLYINNRYKGKYKTTDTITIRSKITSVNILFLKTPDERLAEGWKSKTVFKFARQNSENPHPFKPKISLFINSWQNFDFQSDIAKIRYVNKTARLNSLFIKKYFFSNRFHVTGLYLNKNTSVRTQYSLNFYKNGRFQIYQIISHKENKNLLSEIFLTGKWYCKSFSFTQTKLVLEANFSGYFADNKQTVINNTKILISSTINSGLMKTDKLLSKIYLDFPNDALVNIKTLSPDIVVDMPYAGTNNFTGVQLYKCNKCFLRYEVAKALINVQDMLEEKQMGLKIFDGYRPFPVQAIMFKKFPVPGYVADSIGGSVHNRGAAVDLTIIDKNGKELDMGTGFDELSRKANRTYLMFPDTVLKNRVFLKELMQANNFTPIRSEWWHFNYIDGRKFPKISDDFLCD